MGLRSGFGAGSSAKIDVEAGNRTNLRHLNAELIELGWTPGYQ